MAAPLGETTQELAFAGRTSPLMLIAVGVALGIVMGWLAWRDSRTVRRRLTVPLSMLRLVGVVLVLWMLAEPTALTRTRFARPGWLMMLVDTSASMSVVDGDGRGETARRWAARGLPGEQPKLIAEVDGAAAALDVAHRHFAEFCRASQGNAQSDRPRSLAQMVRQAIESADGHLANAAGLMPPGARAADAELKEVRADLADRVLPGLSECVDAADPTQAAGGPEAAVRREVLLDALADGSRRLARAAQRLASAAATSTGDVPAGQASRIEKVAELLEEANSSWLADLDGDVRVAFYGFDTRPFQAAGPQWLTTLLTRAAQQPMTTDLATALEQVARDAAGEPVVAAVMFTDGAHNAERDPLRIASALPVPLYVVPIGDTEPLRDMVLHHVQAPRTVLESDLIVIEATVDAYQCNGEQLRVDLLQGDHVLDTDTATVTSDAFARRLVFVQKAGMIGSREFTLRVAPVPDERLEDNNVGHAQIEVVDDILHVLLADGMPRWEYRYLRNLLKRDEHVRAVPMLIEPHPRSQLNRPAEGGGFPRDLDDWARNRVVILGDLPPDVLTTSDQDMLEEYVAKRGGTVIVVAGRDAMPGRYVGQPLEKLLPVDLGSPSEDARKGGYGLFVTEEGRTVPALQLSEDPLVSDRVWREMGGRLPVYGITSYCRPKPTAHVLIAAWPQGEVRRPGSDAPAFLCWQQYGRGRVVYLSAPITYRLRYRHGDCYHHRFWGQLLRWAVAREMAAGAATVRIMTDKLRYEVGDEIQVSVQLRDLNGLPVHHADCAVSVQRAGGRAEETVLTEDDDEFGIYRCVLRDVPSGPLNIEAVGPSVQTLLEAEGHAEPVSTLVTVSPPGALELRQTRCNLPLLKELAESSGGGVIGPAGLESVVALSDLSPEVTETVTQRPLWVRWPFLWVFLSCLTVEWAVRKLYGLA